MPFVLALFHHRQFHLLPITGHRLLATGHCSRATDRSSLAPRPTLPRPTPHAPRPTIFGVRRRCRAPSRVQPPPPGGSTCYDMLRFPLPARVRRAMFSAQVIINSEFTSNPRLALVEHDSRHKCSTQKELRRHDPRSKFPQKSPFRPHFRAFYPHSAHKSALIAEEPPTLWHPGKVVGPQRPPGHRSPAPRPTTAGPAGSGRAQTFP